MVFLYDLTLPTILCRIAAALIHAGLQGGLLALILRGFGDRRAWAEGRGSFNPFSHVLLSGVFLTIAFRMNWVMPPDYDANRKGWRRYRPLLAVLVSLGVMVALVPLLDHARAPIHAALPRGPGYWALATLGTLQEVLVGSSVLALLPLPGLLLGSALPAIWPKLARRFRKLRMIGMAAAAVLVILGWFPDWQPLVKALRIV